MCGRKDQGHDTSHSKWAGPPAYLKVRLMRGPAASAGARLGTECCQCCCVDPFMTSKSPAHRLNLQARKWVPCIQVWCIAAVRRWIPPGASKAGCVGTL